MVYLGKSVEKKMHLNAKPEIMKFAREMRKSPTESEEKLWKELRKLRNIGFIFRRQHPLDIFIADFYCHKLKLVIEVDGEIHDSTDAIEYDEARSSELVRFGITILRFKNQDVINHIDNVLCVINNYISDNSSPSLPGEGDRGGEVK